MITVVLCAYNRNARYIYYKNAEASSYQVYKSQGTNMVYTLKGLPRLQGGVGAKIQPKCQQQERMSCFSLLQILDKAQGYKVHCMNGLTSIQHFSSYKTGVLVITAQLSTENTVQVPLVQYKILNTLQRPSDFSTLSQHA